MAALRAAIGNTHVLAGNTEGAFRATSSIGGSVVDQNQIEASNANGACGETSIRIVRCGSFLPALQN